MAIKQIFKNGRVILLLILLLLSIVAINPQPWRQGVAIRSVIKDGPADIAGIPRPESSISPMAREIITHVNNMPIKNIEDYYSAVRGIPSNQTVKITSNKKTYFLISDFEKEIVEEGNETMEIVLDKVTLGMDVYNAPKTNLVQGLDLQGGTRVLLQPEEEVSSEKMDLVISILEKRLNTLGLSDLTIRQASDLSNNQYILIDIAGMNTEQARTMLAREGKFEAKIGNTTVFSGGDDIVYVCMNNAECSGIDPTRGCSRQTDGVVCAFRFSITLSPEAAQRQADATRNLNVLSESGYEYLSEKLVLYLDNKHVDELNIGADLKGRAVTDIQISGSGAGESAEIARNQALENMKSLQVILQSGSLPVKLNIVKMDQISPRLGESFIKNIGWIGLLIILAITGVIVGNYKKLKLSLPIMITLLSEVTLLLGFAAMLRWNLDLISIAGILIALGSGVDDLIIITDETLKGKDENKMHGIKQKLKMAFFIVIAAYFTTVVAMLPLLKAGAGLVEGFARITIVGVTIGVLITRPTFAAIVKILLKEESEKDEE